MAPVAPAVGGPTGTLMRADARPARPFPQTLTRSLRATEHRLLLAAGDFVAGLAAVVLALWLWSIPAGAQFSTSFIAANLPWLPAAVLWLIAAGLPAGHPSVAFSLRDTGFVLLRGAMVLAIVYVAVYFYAPRGVLPRLVVLYFLWEALLLTFAWRLIFVAVFSRARFRHRAVVVGSGQLAAEALDTLRQRGSDVAAVVSDNVEPGLAGDAPTVGAADLAGVLRAGQVSEIVLALRRAPDGALLETLLAGQEAGIEVVRVQTLIEQTRRRVPVTLLEPDWLMTDLADAMRLREASWLGKRALDVAGSLFGLVVAAILSPFIAVAIWMESGGPILYRQERLGRGGLPFLLGKFRTMRQDAERPGEARWSGPDDPRVTRVGRFLRRTRLDELPQLLSVLKGDMSLVGPRPEREEFVATLQHAVPFYRARLMVPPGLTGWAQVNLPYGDSEDAARAKLEYDLYYIKHRGLAFDVAIILRTIGTVLRLKGI